MASQMFISYIDPNVTDTAYTPFVNIENLFDTMYITSEFNSGGAVKASGIDIPNLHGIYPVQHPVKDQNLDFKFLFRGLVSPSTTKPIMREFVTFLYSIGVFHVKYDDEDVYRRMQFYSSDDYEVFNGIFGYDIELTITLKCVDSLVYATEYTSEQIINYSAVGDQPTFMTSGIHRTNSLGGFPVIIMFITSYRQDGRLSIADNHGNVVSIPSATVLTNSQRTLTIDCDQQTITGNRWFNSAVGAPTEDLTSYAEGSFPEIQYGLNNFLLQGSFYQQSPTNGSIAVSMDIGYLERWL